MADIFDQIAEPKGTDIFDKIMLREFPDELMPSHAPPKQTGILDRSYDMFAKREQSLKEKLITIDKAKSERMGLPEETQVTAPKAKAALSIAPWLTSEAIKGFMTPVLPALKSIGMDTGQALDTAIEYWKSNIGDVDIPDFSVSISPFKVEPKSASLKEVVGGTAGAAGMVAGPINISSRAAGLVTQQIAKAARPLYQTILKGMITGGLLGEGDEQKTLENMALFGVFEPLAYGAGKIGDAINAVKNSDRWRMATIKERGLILQNIDETISKMKQSGASEAEILRTLRRQAPEKATERFQKIQGIRPEEPPPESMPVMPEPPPQPPTAPGGIVVRPETPIAKAPKATATADVFDKIAIALPEPEPPIEPAAPKAKETLPSHMVDDPAQLEPRLVETEIERTRKEQAKRLNVLSDEAELSQKAQEGGLTTEQMRQLLETNYQENQNRLDRFVEYFQSDEFKAKRAAATESSKKIKFKDTTPKAKEPWEIEKLNPVDKGNVRLYRGEERIKTETDVETGTSFSPDIEYAKRYANAPKGGSLYYIDVPREILESPKFEELRLTDAYTNKTHEVQLPHELQKQYGGKKVIPKTPDLKPEAKGEAPPPAVSTQSADEIRKSLPVKKSEFETDDMPWFERNDIVAAMKHPTEGIITANDHAAMETFGYNAAENGGFFWNFSGPIGHQLGEVGGARDGIDGVFVSIKDLDKNDFYDVAEKNLNNLQKESQQKIKDPIRYNRLTAKSGRMYEAENGQYFRPSVNKKSFEQLDEESGKVLKRIPKSSILSFNYLKGYEELSEVPPEKAAPATPKAPEITEPAKSGTQVEPTYTQEQLSSIEVNIKAVKEDTGSIFTIKEKADKALREIDEQIETYYALLDCVS